jgi:sucrose synthase
MIDINLVKNFIEERDSADFREFLAYVCAREKGLFLRNDIIQILSDYCVRENKPAEFSESSSISKFLKKVQVLFLCEEHLVVMRRQEVARYRFFRIRKDGEYMEEITLSSFLDLQNAFVFMESGQDKHPDVDFGPFYSFTPSIRDRKSIGNGIKFLSRYLSSQLFSNPGEWNQAFFEFIKRGRTEGISVMINDSIIDTFEQLTERLEIILDQLSAFEDHIPYTDVQSALAREGFEAGWGDTVGRIRETMQLLLDLVQEPSDDLLESCISRVPIPLILRVAIVSPHGWFGQTNTLGKPDTGGQVIYILDQVRVLERYLQELLNSAGLDVKPRIIVLTRLLPEAGDTTCDQRLEKIFNTENAWILRVPFRDEHFNMKKEWVSRFQIWPYLERFAEDSIHELTSEFHGDPDLIIGNYSDGNLVSSLLSDHFGSIQCTIAHALEKPKYHLSDVYWQEKEDDYNFSIHFTSDILSMNKSDFIITSTLQEIVGTEETMGQYESYQFFTMPGLYKVVSGVNLFDPKFNVISPGVDENLYFPYYQEERRTLNTRQRLQQTLFLEVSDEIFGELKDPDKRPIFTMARFDKIKNITGLIEAFGMSEKLKDTCNLIFAAGSIHLENATDREERAEIEKAQELIERFDLYGKVRWLPSITKLDTGEVYRIAADRGGMFVQPALFEAFGLTILEAMASGLPTFAPRFGGPLEIIESGVHGFLMDTSDPKLMAECLEEFIDASSEDDGYWGKISEAGIERVRENFNWDRYARKLVNLTKLYGFWRHTVSGKGRGVLDRYCDLINHFLIRERARKMGS